MSGITPAKGDLVVDQGNESMVGNGHAMGVKAEILEHILGAAEGWFRVDHPGLAKRRSQPGGEGFGVSEGLQGAMEAELALTEAALQSGDKLAAENPPEYRDGKKEARAGWNSMRVIERQSAGGHDTVHVRVMTPTPTLP
jgi:hypothetical protein